MLAVIVVTLCAFVSSCLAQTAGDIRLVNVDDVTQPPQMVGRLEIYHNDTWGTVCSEDFDVFDGDIACQQLGFLYADRVGAVGELGLDVLEEDSEVPIWLSEVACNSQDTQLMDCDTLDTELIECVHSQDVGLKCSNAANQLRVVSLTGENSSLSAGRLEIFINNEWGTVCNDGFGINDANVACRQMGFIEAMAYDSASNLGYTASVNTPIWLDGLSCPLSSSHANLRTCDHTGTGIHDCSHSEDIILSCLANGNLRLATSAFPSQSSLPTAGRLEIYLMNEWGTVCDDAFSQVAADIACKQLGFRGATDFGTDLGFASSASSFTEIWLDEVGCEDSHTTLLSCPNSGVGEHDCDHSEDIQLECDASMEPSVPPPAGGNNISVGGIVGASIAGIVVLVVIIVGVVLAGVALLYSKPGFFKHTNMGSGA